MKHLKTYKIFESVETNLKEEVLEIYQDFLDHFNIGQTSHNKDWYTNKRIVFGIVDSEIRFGKGIKVIIRNSGNYGGVVEKGPNKGFDGLPDDISSELKKAHNRCLQHLNFKHHIIGSYYAYQSGGFSITYYTEQPSFKFEGKEFNPEYLCGEDVYVRDLPLLNGYLICKSSHSNIFDFFGNDDHINGMFCTYGYMDDTYRYYNPISITSGKDCDKYGYCTPNTPIEQWITKQWSDVCRKYKIRKSTRAWNVSREMKDDGDPTVYEFMDYLVDHQDDFKNYKQLPKVNKDRWS